MQHWLVWWQRYIMHMQSDAAAFRRHTNVQRRGACTAYSTAQGATTDTLEDVADMRWQQQQQQQQKLGARQPQPD
jgi:hypothetical protein